MTKGLLYSINDCLVSEHHQSLSLFFFSLFQSSFLLHLIFANKI